MYAYVGGRVINKYGSEFNPSLSYSIPLVVDYAAADLGGPEDELIKKILRTPSKAASTTSDQSSAWVSPLNTPTPHKLNSDEANAVGTALSALGVFFEQSARHIEVPYAAFKVRGTGRALGSIGNVLGAAGLYEDVIDYRHGDPNMSGVKLSYHFGSFGASYVVGSAYGGIPGLIVGTSLYTAEKSYEGVVWYGDQLSRGSVNFTNALNRGWRFGK